MPTVKRNVAATQRRRQDQKIGACRGFKWKRSSRIKKRKKKFPASPETETSPEVDQTQPKRREEGAGVSNLYFMPEYEMFWVSFRGFFDTREENNSKERLCECLDLG